MTGAMYRRTYAALQYMINNLEPGSWAEAIQERGVRLVATEEYGGLAISPRPVPPGPRPPSVRCRHPEDVRLERVRTHLICVRGDLLSIGLDFEAPFPEIIRKIMNGEHVGVVEYNPRRTVTKVLPALEK
ncbi:hypothetical protein ACFY9C_35215 [Streptomyces filamentosus]|uniref:hypothetical protein n=1 Tax=Streptomyces filamentosus TaxID=67294 RepID=UPI0036E805BA